MRLKAAGQLSSFPASDWTAGEEEPLLDSPGAGCTAFRALPWLAKFDVLGLFAAIAACVALLWPQWRHDDNLTHGLFLPLLTAILAVESRRDPNPRFLRHGTGSLAACVFLVLSSLASFAVAILYAAALGWTHAMAEFMLSATLVFALGAAWLGFADQRVRFFPLNWPAAVAVVLWLFASPPPPGTYARLALLLQIQVTGGVTHILNGLGIAAYQDGNLIELARTSVGVSEACSGVRSLISCTVAGLFLSALLVRRPRHRALIIALSPAIGLGMNFLRSLLLTLLANSGVDIGGKWHDLTGACILAGTTILVVAFALWLRGRESELAPGPGQIPVLCTGRSPLLGLVAALLLATGAVGLLAAASQPLRKTTGHDPDLAALFPPAPTGWTVQATPNLDQYSGILHTHALMERVYSAGSARESAHLVLYLAYWRPGQASVSLVDEHTPDSCWPSVGWKPEPVPSERPTVGIASRLLAPAEYRLFAHDGIKMHIWFWHLYGGRPLAFVDPYSVSRFLGSVWHRGFGQAEDQLFVRVSSDRPWQEIASQPALQQFFANLKPLGL